MRAAFDRTWTGLAALASAVGLFAAFRGFATTALLGSFAAAAVLVVMWVLPFLPADTPLVPPLVRAGLLGGLLVWVLMGVLRVIGPAGVPLVLVLLVTSPPVLRWCGRILHGPAPESHLRPPDAMSDAELCQEWRRSLAALQSATTPASRMSVVAMRARYLDELERRAGPRFHTWLESDHGSTTE